MLQQCVGKPPAEPAAFRLRFTEGFATSFKTRHPGVTPSNPDAPIQEGCCRISPFGSESGYYVPTPESIGRADSGTRLAARFNNIPAGGTLFVSAKETTGSTASVRLMGASTSAVVNGTTFSEIPVVGGTALAVYEVVGSNPNVTDYVETLGFLRVSPGTAAGTSSVTGAFEAPELFAGVDRAGRPVDKVPAFSAGDLISDPARGAPAAFTVRACGTSGFTPQAAVTSGALPVNYRQQGNVPTGLSFYLFSRGDPITDVKAGNPNVSWFTVDQNTTTTPVTFKINLNPAGLAPGSYTGSFPVSANGIGTTTFTIPLNVLPAGPHFTRWGVTNAASYVPNVISPGGVQTIFGDRLGPRDPVTAQITPEGKLSTKIGDTRVLVNGVESPMVYSSSGQVSFITPLALSTGDTLYVLEVEHQGVKSPQVVVPVLRAVPALLTANGSGFGPAAALNQDNSFNSVIGELPGRYVSFFGVGGPPTDPPGRDGEINTALGRFTEPVKVLFNGQEVPAADVAYAGPAPSLVHGAWQSVVRIPANAKRNQPNYIQFVFGDVATQPGVEVLVQ